MKSKDRSGLHEGHRARMRERFLSAGGNGLADHELLEMLLYYAVPRRDTNDMAHRLIEEFGTLSGAIEADVSMLCRLDGVKEGTAVYLKLVGELVRRYTAQKLSASEKEPFFDTPEKIAAFMMPKYVGIKEERVYLLLFDNGMRLLDCFHVCDGSVAGVPLSVRRIAERAYQKRAVAAVLTHNHPGGLAVPSGEDIRLTRHLDEALRLLEVPLLEHYIFSDRTYAPIMSRYRTEGQAEYAASSLFELLHKRLREIRESE